MPRAVLNDVVLAESASTVAVEGNHYFPPESVNWDYFEHSRFRTLCPWKGLASYHNVVVDDKVIADAAWYYPHPSPLGRRIKNHVAFYPPVQIEPSEHDVPREGFLKRLLGRAAGGQQVDANDGARLGD